MKSDTYSQCKATCPSGTGWECDTPSPTVVPTLLPTPVPSYAPASTLRDAADRVGMAFGAVVKYKFLPEYLGEETTVNYTTLMRREYNWFTAENGCKWKYTWKVGWVREGRRANCRHPTNTPSPSSLHHHHAAVTTRTSTTTYGATPRSSLRSPRTPSFVAMP